MKNLLIVLCALCSFTTNAEQRELSFRLTAEISKVGDSVRLDTPSIRAIDGMLLNIRLTDSEDTSAQHHALCKGLGFSEYIGYGSACGQSELYKKEAQGVALIRGKLFHLTGSDWKEYVNANPDGCRFNSVLCR